MCSWGTENAASGQDPTVGLVSACTGDHTRSTRAATVLRSRLCLGLYVRLWEARSAVCGSAVYSLMWELYSTLRLEAQNQPTNVLGGHERVSCTVFLLGLLS